MPEDNLDTVTPLVREECWSFFGEYTGGAGITGVYVTNDQLTDIMNAGNIVVQGVSFSLLDTNNNVAHPAAFQRLTTSSFVGVYLDSFVTTANIITTKAFYPLNIPMRLQETTEPFWMGFTASGVACYVAFAAWGVFDKGLREAPAVRFATPQTVSVDGVRLWRRG